MLFLIVFIGLCWWGIREAVHGERRTPKQPSSLIPKTPQRLSLETTVRKIAGSDVAEEKLNALTLDAPHALIQARAGSGKTQTIALRMALAVHQGIQPQNLLCLCFNKSAAQELSARLAKYGAGNVPASTFHALAYGVLKPKEGSLIFGENQRALMRQLVGRGAVRREEKEGKDESELVDDLLTFISSAKHRGLSVEDVRKRCVGAGSLVSEAASLYAAYTRHLKQHGLMDFDDLIEAATVKLKASSRLPVVRLGGQACDLNDLRLLAVDEAQDLSRSFYGLVQALMRKNPSMQVYAVGDDYQSICAYAGSDLDYFQHFETHFPGGKRSKLMTNYRSGSVIVEHANRHMRGLGEGGEAIRQGGSVESMRVSGNITETLRKLIVQERNRSVLVLARRNICHGKDLMAWGKDLSSLHPNVRVSTVHGAKGGEADVVIYLKEPARTDRLSRLNAVLGQTKEEIQAEEKRLVYVGFTRARDRLVAIE